MEQSVVNETSLSWVLHLYLLNQSHEAQILALHQQVKHETCFERRFLFTGMVKRNSCEGTSASSLAMELNS